MRWRRQGFGGGHLVVTEYCKRGPLQVHLQRWHRVEDRCVVPGAPVPRIAAWRVGGITGVAPGSALSKPALLLSRFGLACHTFIPTLQWLVEKMYHLPKPVIQMRIVCTVTAGTGGWAVHDRGRGGWRPVAAGHAGGAHGGAAAGGGDGLHACARRHPRRPVPRQHPAHGQRGVALRL